MTAVAHRISTRWIVYGSAVLAAPLLLALAWLGPATLRGWLHAFTLGGIERILAGAAALLIVGMVATSIGAIYCRSVAVRSIDWDNEGKIYRQRAANLAGISIALSLIAYAASVSLVWQLTH